MHFYLWKESYVSNTTYKNGKTFLGKKKTKKQTEHKFEQKCIRIQNSSKYKKKKIQNLPITCNNIFLNRYVYEPQRYALTECNDKKGILWCLCLVN